MLPNHYYQIVDSQLGVYQIKPPAKFLIPRFLLFVWLCISTLSPTLGQGPQLYILNRGGHNVLSVPLDSVTNIPSEKINQGLWDTYDLISPQGSGKLYWANGISHQILSSDDIGGGMVNANIAEVSVLVDLDFDPYQNKIYWADNIRKNICRSNPDGTFQEVVTPDTFPNLSSITIYPSLDLMFFADIDSNLIWSSTLSGTNRKVFVDDSLGTPVRLLIDTVQQKLYWADDSQHQIERINLDGTSREIFYQGDEKERPLGLFLDQTTAQLYWTDYGTDQIVRANLDGSPAIPIITIGLTDPVAVIKVTPLAPFGPNQNDRNIKPKESKPGTEEPSVLVYPNPASNLLTIASGESTQPMERVLVMDKSGRQMFSASLNKNFMQIDISLFPEGLYTYSVSIGGKILYGHFSIIH